jgi:hypothetical protein
MSTSLRTSLAQIEDEATPSLELVPSSAPRLGLLRPIAQPAEIIASQEATRVLIHEALLEGRDYGKIPGIDKPSLLKPGAERVCLAFGCTPRYTVVEKEVEHDRPVPWRKVKAIWEGPRGNKRKVRDEITEGTSLGLYRYVVQCDIVHRESGQVVGSSIGSCSTMESKYVDRPRDCENTIIKMAQKRAHVGATLGAFGLSEQFTQDVEDMPREMVAGDAADDDSVKCPKCQGAMWDNREKNDEREKAGQKRMPDYKCKDRNCETVIWDAAKYAEQLAANDAVGTTPAETAEPAPAEPETALERASKVPLLGGPDKFDNCGGKPLGVCPDKVLTAALNFFKKKLREGSTDARLEAQVEAIATVIAYREGTSPQEALDFTPETDKSAEMDDVVNTGHFPDALRDDLDDLPF